MYAEENESAMRSLFFLENFIFYRFPLHAAIVESFTANRAELKRLTRLWLYRREMFLIAWKPQQHRTGIDWPIGAAWQCLRRKLSVNYLKCILLPSFVILSRHSACCLLVWRLSPVCTAKKIWWVMMDLKEIVCVFIIIFIYFFSFVVFLSVCRYFRLSTHSTLGVWRGMTKHEWEKWEKNMKRDFNASEWNGREIFTCARRRLSFAIKFRNSFARLPGF